jgi:hypothetical protein
VGRTNRLLSFDTTRTEKKTTLPTIRHCRRNVFTEPLPSNDRDLHILCFNATRIAYKTTRPTIVSCTRCRGNVFTERLPSNDSGGYTYRHTDWWEGFMKYAVEMGSVATLCIPSFIKTGSGIQKVRRGDTQRRNGDRINPLFSQDKESRLKIFTMRELDLSMLVSLLDCSSILN